jgi:hypothetical protein
MEAGMLLCEAAILVCSILLVKWDMVTDDGVEGYEDMEVYTVLCSVSTFLALSITLSLLLVPTHVRICSALHGAERKRRKAYRTVPAIREDAVHCLALLSFFQTLEPVFKCRNEQVWKKLEEQGIGKVLAAIAVKIPAAGGFLRWRTRGNQVAAASLGPLKGTEQIVGGLQRALDVKDRNVVV